jgi:hypothetical protein
VIVNLNIIERAETKQKLLVLTLELPFDVISILRLIRNSCAKEWRDVNRELILPPAAVNGVVVDSHEREPLNKGA